jgi:hypothetical protein
VLLMAVFAAAEYALIAFMIVVIDPGNWSFHLSKLPFISPELLTSSSWNPIAWAIRLIGGIPLSLFQATVYTVAYIQFIKEIEYPGIGKQADT